MDKNIKDNAPGSGSLSERELSELQDQLLEKQRELTEIEQGFKTREIEFEERLADIHKREMAILGAESRTKSETAVRENDGDQDINSILWQELRELKAELRELKSSAENVTADAPIAPELNTGINTHLSFKDILESIPSYSGDNIPILKFTRACRRAKDMISPSLEPTFTRLLRNKLKGRAYTAIEDDTFRTIASFTDRLKDIFGNSKSVNQFKGELGNVTKGKTEHVLDYISRVKDLHSAICDAETETTGRLSRLQRESLEEETMECFVAGLPPDFRLRLKFEGYVNLSAAYQTAIKIEKEVERDKSRFQETLRASRNFSNSFVGMREREGERERERDHFGARFYWENSLD